MRLPEYESLSKSQVDIYRDKIEGNMLVSGPPGSGKTILALHRAAKLKAEYAEDAVTLIMFNNTLCAYSKQGKSNTSLDLDDVKITTQNRWINGWYNKWKEYDKNNRDPNIKWPFYKNRGIWLPIYSEIMKQVHALSKEKLSKLDWGHLIIDEGQDFPEELYLILIEAQYKLNKNGFNHVTISVFADDNQTITSQNSSVKQIKAAMEMKRNDSRHYRIFENYRNSKEIYNFAKHFQVTGSNSTLEPKLETGDIPWVMFRDSIDDFYDIILRVAENANKAVGVICLKYSTDVINAINGLKHRAKSAMKAQVQGYSSSSVDYKKASKIHFDKGGSITVVHSKSAKGLEFDVVFVLNTEALQVDNEHAFDKFKELYVVNTRAREQLRLCFIYDKIPSSFGLLPKNKKDKDYRIQTNIPEVDNEIELFEGWIRSPEECAEEARAQVLNIINTRYSNYPIDNKKVEEIIKKMKKEISNQFEIQDDSLESLSWFIVEMNMQNKLDQIIEELIHVHSSKI